MGNNNQTLIILSPGFPKNEDDSSCLPFLQDFIKEINRLYPSLAIIILAFDYPFLSGPYSWNGNKVISLNGWQKKNIRKAIKWFHAWRTLRKINRTENLVGLFSLWCGECAYIANRFSKKNNLKHFCWIQGQDAKSENNYVSMIKLPGEELVALSDFLQDEFEKNHSVKPKHVIPLGIGMPGFPCIGTTRDIDILGVGSLIPLKRYALFIEIISRLKEDFPAIRVVLCGKGPEESMLKSLIKKNNLSNTITLTGELPHAEILQYMCRSRLFLHTSVYEGLNVSCLEALNAGCRIISFVQPMHYPIQNWEVVQTKEEAIYQLGNVLKDPSIRYQPVKPFEMGETVKKIMQLYDYKELIN